MDKIAVYKSLTKMFGGAHVRGWLYKFADDYRFDPLTFVGEFVNYLNSLPVFLEEPADA